MHGDICIIDADGSGRRIGRGRRKIYFYTHPDWRVVSRFIDWILCYITPCVVCNTNSNITKIVPVLHDEIWVCNISVIKERGGVYVTRNGCDVKKAYRNINQVFPG